MVRKSRRRHNSTSRRSRQKSGFPFSNDVVPTESIQCCGGYMDAAEAGHLQCLQGLLEAGCFLPLGSPDRASAGESRKLEIWNAAFASCRADHAHMLSWLFESGWPSDFDAVLPWHMGDLMESRDLIKEGWPVKFETCWTSADVWHRELRNQWHSELRNQFMPELDLYRQAMRNPTPACLESLLKAGCRSVWICRLAAKEQKPAFLTLAASRGCPCDPIALWLAATAGNLPLLEAVQSAALLPEGFLSCGNKFATQCIKEAAKGATDRGDAACLAALLKWFGAATSGISLDGGLACLHALQRAGCLDLEAAVKCAAERAQVESLKYLLDLDPNLARKPLLLWTSQCCTGPPGAIIECMEFLQGAGCQWSREALELGWAASSGWVEVLQYCLERVRVCLGETELRQASWRGSLNCMQVWYDNGCVQREDPVERPAESVFSGAYAVGRQNRLECLQCLVRQSGKPDPQKLSTLHAFHGGDDILRYVCELGAVLDKDIANVTAAAGRIEALQYVLANGAPWSSKTFECAIFGDKSRWLKPLPGGLLGCLQCLHEHARAAACPDDSEELSLGSAFESYEEGFCPSLEVLQYLCDHMGPTWADPVLKAMAYKLEFQAMDMIFGTAGHADWQMVQIVLYLARKLKDGFLLRMDELVAERRERAAALAGVFFRAGRLAHKRRPSPSLALWDAVGRLPPELQERIASQAHLILL